MKQEVMAEDPVGEEKTNPPSPNSQSISGYAGHMGRDA